MRQIKIFYSWTLRSGAMCICDKIKKNMQMAPFHSVHDVSIKLMFIQSAFATTVFISIHSSLLLNIL